MNIKLSNSYNGLIINPWLTECYYCYTIYDREYNMFYSGVKTNKTTTIACIGNDYFTSSSVTDFKQRFQQNPNQFDIYVEYFHSAKLAFRAEKDYHNYYNVGKSKLFYNAIKSGGSNCGAGSVLCKNTKGEIYRVSCREFQNNKHTHVSANLIHVYKKTDLTRLLTIDKDEYDSRVHITQFKNHVLCRDLTTGRNRRIAKDVYESNPTRYVGITKGKVTAYQKIDDKKVTISIEEYNKNDYYVKCQPKSVNVYDTEQDKFIKISREEYRNNKCRYKHRNSFFVNVYDIRDRNKKTISKNEFNTNMQYYRKAMDVRGYIFKYHNTLFSNRMSLARYLDENSEIRRKFKWVDVTKLTELFPSLQVISFKKYKLGERFA